MMKPLKKCRTYEPPKIGEFSPHAHPIVKFIWKEIVNRRLNITSVADAAGVDRSTLHKWRKAVKGPYILQMDEVLHVLGYELKISKIVKGDIGDKNEL